MYTVVDHWANQAMRDKYPKPHTHPDLILSCFLVLFFLFSLFFFPSLILALSLSPSLFLALSFLLLVPFPLHSAGWLADN